MSIRSNAKREMDAINFGAEDTETMVKILDLFFDRWDSGGSVAIASDVLMRLINGQPLGPLTGGVEEWVEVGGGLQQNNRCGTVFMEGGRAYDIDVPGRPTIAFPYDPTTKPVRFPVFDVETGEP